MAAKVQLQIDTAADDGVVEPFVDFKSYAHVEGYADALAFHALPVDQQKPK
jgi:hypothetical protein